MRVSLFLDNWTQFLYTGTLFFLFGLFFGFLIWSEWGSERRLRILVRLYGWVIRYKHWRDERERRKRDGDGGNGRVA